MAQASIGREASGLGWYFNMPGIIDSFFVQVGLDASQFTIGQREADKAWTKTKDQPDSVSRAFRKLFKSRGQNVRLDEEIWEVWRQSYPSTSPLISQLRGVFHFRHWLAHGRYWQVGNKYDFERYIGASKLRRGVGEFARNCGCHLDPPIIASSRPGTETWRDA